MKIQIDTKNKTLKVEDNIKLSELIKNLNRLFPNKEWKEYTLETSTNIYSWSNPIYIEKHYPANPAPYYPWTNPMITWDCSATKKNESLYNVEC